MTILEKTGAFLTDRDIADVAAACDKIALAMNLPPDAIGKLKITAQGGAASLTLPAGEGANCAEEKTQALIDNPTASFTDECVFQVGDRTVSWQGGIRAACDFEGGERDLIIAFSGLAGWQDLFFSIGAAVVFARKGSFGGGYVLPIDRLEGIVNRNRENSAIYSLLKAIL